MTGVLVDMAISLDGMVPGPGGADVDLYDWYFDPSPASRPVVDELVATTGAAGLDLRLTKMRVVDAPNVTHTRCRVDH
jgi:hypothetical protein